MSPGALHKKSERFNRGCGCARPEGPLVSSHAREGVGRRSISERSAEGAALVRSFAKASSPPVWNCRTFGARSRLCVVRFHALTGVATN